MPLSLALAPLCPLLLLPSSNSLPLSPLPRLPLLPRPDPTQLSLDTVNLGLLLCTLVARRREDGLAGNLERGLECRELVREQVWDEGVCF